MAYAGLDLKAPPQLQALERKIGNVAVDPTPLYEHQLLRAGDVLRTLRDTLPDESGTIPALEATRTGHQMETVSDALHRLNALDATRRQPTLASSLADALPGFDRAAGALQGAADLVPHTFPIGADKGMIYMGRGAIEGMLSNIHKAVALLRP